MKSDTASRSVINSNKKYLNQDFSANKSNINLSKTKDYLGVPAKDKQIEIHPFSLNINLSNQKNVQS